MALKAMSKAQVVAYKQEKNVMNEKNIMVLCNSPFILKLFSTYKDEQNIYLLLEFCQGGELFTVEGICQNPSICDYIEPQMATSPQALLSLLHQTPPSTE